MKLAKKTCPSSRYRLRSKILAIVMGASALACGIKAATPAGFVELPNQTDYDYRATTVDGVVIGIRELDHEPEAELAFWAAAIEKQLREHRGYALLGTDDVVTAHGLSGKQLRFGYDQRSEPHLYFVTIFIAEGGVFSRSKLFLIEAGGKKELVEQEAAQIDYAITNFRH